MIPIRRKFDNRIKNPDPHIVSLLGEIDGLRGECKSGLRSAPETIVRFRRSTIITSAGASTRIEGSRLSDREVEKILRSLSVSKFSDRDSQEVQGYLETLQNIFESFDALPLKESIIMSLHRQALKYSNKDTLHRGSYKKKENTVGILGKDGKVSRIIFETTRAYLTPKEMQELVEWTSEALEKNRFHPLLVMANFIVAFLKIHPFEDGNGRLSRLLTNLLLLRSGYQFSQYVSHEHIVERRKDEYYLALRTSQKTFKTSRKSIAPWLQFFLSVVKEQAAKALVLLQEEQTEDILSPKQYIVWKHLSDVGESGPMKIVKKTGIALGTVRQALQRLVLLGRIKRIGRGRATRYVVP